MASYHQMGHHSSNLVDLPQLSDYAGAIYSPINCEEDQAALQIEQSRAERKKFTAIFDPQLYIPGVSKGKLGTWSYFPADFDSADSASLAWWRSVSKKLAKCCAKIGADAVCSPTKIPKLFEDGFYSQSLDVAHELRSHTERPVLATVVASLADLTAQSRAMEIASIVSRYQGDGVYLVFLGDTEPRRELTAGDELVGGMKLINAISQSGLDVTVGFTSSDMLLWKYAGATSCASGKFFNLRRFTRTRFDEPKDSGGRQIEYWFEEALLAFLRPRDLSRIRAKGVPVFSEATQRNPFCDEILKNLDSDDPQRWLSFGWRQFLYWFADAEARIDSEPSLLREMLETADKNWGRIEKAKIFMAERENDGAWIREWMNVVEEFDESK